MGSDTNGYSFSETGSTSSAHYVPPPPRTPFTKVYGLKSEAFCEEQAVILPQQPRTTYMIYDTLHSMKNSMDFKKQNERCCLDIPIEELSIYFQYKFKSLMDETLKLGAFQEYQVENNKILLYFPRVVEQSLCDQFWIVQEGPLAITFTTDKKILSWQLCIRLCETLVHRRALLSQVSEILRNAGVSSASSGPDQQAIQKNSDKIIKIGCELAKLEENMGLSAQDLGTHMINDASNCMKDFIHFNPCNQQRIDCLHNNAAQQASGHRIQNQVIGGSNQQANLQGPGPSNPPSNPPILLDTSASQGELMTSSTAASSASTDNVFNDLSADDFFNDFFDGIDLDNYHIDSSNLDGDLLKYI